MGKRIKVAWGFNAKLFISEFSYITLKYNYNVLHLTYFTPFFKNDVKKLRDAVKEL